jgi:uncharacterized protein (DUF362 family)
MSRVSIVRSGAAVEAAVRQAVAQAGGLAGIVESGDVVAIKVNMVMDAPANSGMVTDPAVARAVVRLAREAGAGQVLIVEGTAQYREGDANRDRFATRAAFRVAGYDADGDMLDDATGAPLIDLNDSGGTEVADPAKVTKITVPSGLIRKEYWLPNAVLQADVLISVPVLKNHYLAGLTLGMKNQIGLLPADLYHGPGNIYGKHSLAHGPIELDQHIVDLSLARRPDFVVVDGQRGMIDGPIGSQIIEPAMGLIMAGQDVVAVDTVGALVIGYDPRAIPYLELAGQNGLGQADTRHIRVVGIPLDQVRRDFPAPYQDAPARRAEAQPPTVAMTSPGNDELQGKFTVAAEASDNEGIARLVLYLDNERVGQALTPPYEFALDTGQYEPGAHTLRLIAFDYALNRSVISRQVSFLAPTATSSATATATSPVSEATSSNTPTRLPPTIVASKTPTIQATPTDTFVPPSPVSQATATAAPSPPSRATATAPPTPPPLALATATVPSVSDAKELVTESAQASQTAYPSWLLPLLLVVFALLVLGLAIFVIGLWITSQRG